MIKIIPPKSPSAGPTEIRKFEDYVISEVKRIQPSGYRSSSMITTKKTKDGIELSSSIDTITMERAIGKAADSFFLAAVKLKK